MTEAQPSRTVAPWIPRAAIGVWALTILALGSDAGFNIVGFLLAELGGLLLLGWWLARLVVWLVRRRRSPADEAPSGRGNVPRWTWEPVTIVACWALAYTGVLFPARFAVSRPALQRFAQQVRQRGDSTPPAGQIVGLFRLREVELLPGGVVRLITTPCMFDDCGVVYSPDGRPPVIGEDSYEQLSGGWWHWYRSW